MSVPGIVKGKGLREVLALQLGDVAFEKRQKEEQAGYERQDPFDEDKITPLMRAATQENPEALLDLLADTKASRCVCVYVYMCMYIYVHVHLCTWGLQIS